MVTTTDNTSSLMEQLSPVEKITGAAAIGLVFGLTSAGFGVWWLGWCGLAPFLVLIRASTNFKEACGVGLAFGFACNLLTLCWLFSFHFTGLSSQIAIIIGTVAALVNATAVALPCAGFAILLYALPMRAGIFPDYRRPYFPYILSAPVAWIFFEHLSGLAIGLHLNDLCYSQCGQLQLIQIARIGGGKLLTFLLVLANTALAQLLVASGNLVKPLGERADRLLPSTGSLVDLMTVILLVVLCALVGRGSPGSCKSSNVPLVSVSVCQAGDGDGVHSAVGTTYGAMLKPAAGAALVVLPVGAAHEFQNTVAPAAGGMIVAGTVTGVKDMQVSVGQVLFARNKLLYLSTHRSYLLSLFALPDYVLHLVYPAAGGVLNGYLALLPGASVQVINTPLGRIGISTNLALASSPPVKEAVRHGSGLLVCMADLGCFHSTILYRQILAAAVLRAVENGRYLVLSTHRGISAVIDPCGKIMVKSLTGSMSILREQVQFLYRDTYFNNVDFN